MRQAPAADRPRPAADSAREFRRGLSAGDDLAGQSLWHYELSERIGAGGMGVVYKAQHRWLGRTVAIKFLTLESLDHPEGLVRFAHEALAIGALDHPNIVRATDAGAYEGIHFLVTEFVEGQDLSKLARAGQPLAPADACEIVRQAALGLEHAHRRGLIHRDIKPSNLIVNGDGVVKLLDFGLARLSPGQSTLTHTGQLIGTLDFLRPSRLPIRAAWIFGPTFTASAARSTFCSPVGRLLSGRTTRQRPARSGLTWPISRGRSPTTATCRWP